MSSNRMSMRASTGESGMRVLPEMFKHRLLQLAEETVDSLQKIWKEAGYEEVECQRLLGDLLTKMKTTCASELAAEQQILDHAKKEVEDNIEELKKLSAQLGRNCNVEHLTKMNCTDKLSELERLINDITTEVSQRQKLMNTELASIKDLVDVLGESFPTMDTFSGPEGTPELSDVRLQLMREYKGELESIKTRRTEEVRGIAKECKSHVTDLVLLTEGFSTMPEDKSYAELDKKIAKFIQSNEFTFGIAKKDIVQISKRLKCFIEEKERRRDELTKTGAEIARLWSLLRIPAAEREQFQSSFKMNLSMETVTKGVNELKRLRELRAKSIGKVVASIRADILLLWEEVGVITDENRAREFPLYFAPTDDMEDSAVDQHEAYFNTLRVKVEELKPILQKVARRETVVQERIELEHLQMNPERLTARGPNAREERKREEGMSTRVRNLEKNTKELIATILAWEETNGPFMYGGERYVERITHQDESYVEIRDSLRNARKKKDGKLDQGTTAAPSKAGSATIKKPTVGTPGKAKAAASAAQELTLSDANIALLNQKLNAAFGGSGSTVDNKSNAENVAPLGGRDSNGSDDTSYTSATEVKERPSTATVFRKMGNVFSPDKPLKEIVRENQRMIKKSIRELEKEIRSLETNEKKLIADIKKHAKLNQMSSVRIMAKDLVRTRNYITRFIEMKTHLNAVSLKMQTIKSHDAMAQAMKGVTKAMVTMNKKINLPGMQKIMAEFMKENERSEMTQEMIGDTLDDAMEEEGSEAEENAIVGQVLDELGINMSEAAPEAPVGMKQAAAPAEEKSDPAISDLEARLNKLK